MNLWGKVSISVLVLVVACGSFSAEARRLSVDSNSIVALERGTASSRHNIKDRVADIIGSSDNNSQNKVQLKTTKMQLLEVESIDSGGTLLFSDSPEYVKENGILYQDIVQGDARVLYYHLNDTRLPKKVAVILEALDGVSVVKVTRGGTSVPSSDYLRVGKATQLAYFGSEPLNDKIFVSPETPRLLKADMDKTVLQSSELVYGVYDFHASSPVRVSVIMYGADVNPFSFIRRATILPRDEIALRGTFQGMNRRITAKRAYHPEREGTVYFPIGDNIRDQYLRGIDATDGSDVVNYGNYGILYEIAIPITGRQSVNYYLSPLGGVYAGAIRAVSSEGSKVWETPAKRAFFGDRTPPETPDMAQARNEGFMFLTTGVELAALGTYNYNQQVKFEYSPPGASNLPVNIILMPAE